MKISIFYNKINLLCKIRKISEKSGKSRKNPENLSRCPQVLKCGVGPSLYKGVFLKNATVRAEFMALAHADQQFKF
jgi:hypothetical protein